MAEGGQTGRNRWEKGLAGLRFSAGASNQILLMKWIYNIQPDEPAATASMPMLPEAAIPGGFALTIDHFISKMTDCTQQQKTAVLPAPFPSCSGPFGLLLSYSPEKSDHPFSSKRFFRSIISSIFSIYRATSFTLSHRSIRPSPYTRLVMDPAPKAMIVCISSIIKIL